MHRLSFLAMCVGVLTGARPVTPVLPAVDARCPAVTVTADEVPSTCVRVAGARVGELPLELDLGGEPVRFVEWAQRDLESSDAIGFRAETPAGVVFAVQAGGETYTGVGAAWLHPAGVVGPRVRAIESVTLCRVPERPADCVGPSVIVD